MITFTVVGDIEWSLEDKVTLQALCERYGVLTVALSKDGLEVFILEIKEKYSVPGIGPQGQVADLRKTHIRKWAS